MFYYEKRINTKIKKVLGKNRNPSGGASFMMFIPFQRVSGSSGQMLKQEDAEINSA
jgi:hypothetical protein